MLVFMSVVLTVWVSVGMVVVYRPLLKIDLQFVNAGRGCKRSPYG